MPKTAVVRVDPKGALVEIGSGRRHPSFRWVKGYVVTEGGRDTTPMVFRNAVAYARLLNNRMPCAKCGHLERDHLTGGCHGAVGEHRPATCACRAWEKPR